MLVIFDARSSLAEKGNKLMGKGSENPYHYRQTKLIFMEIQNIHALRASADLLQALCEEGSEDKCDTLGFHCSCTVLLFATPSLSPYLHTSLLSSHTPFL